MPKGKGAAGAFRADEESVKEEATRLQLAGEEKQVRINLSLPNKILFAADRRVLDRKQKGESLNRSSYIAELIEADVRKQQDEGA